MNKKKYISTGVFLFVVVLALGIAYGLDPAPINNVLGIGSGGVGVVADADLSATDDALSSLPASDTPVGVDDSSASTPSTKVPPKKSTATPLGTARSEEQDDISSSLQGDTTSVADTSDAKNNSSAPDDVAATTTIATLPSVPAAPCVFPVGAPSTTKEILLNEIAWMGSASSSNAEWIELKNNSSDSIDLSGWALSDVSGKIKISFSDGDAIASGGFFLLERGSVTAATDVPAKIYSGDLVNAGDMIALMDSQCVVVDYLDASHGWPAGNNITKATMEQNADGGGWHTSALPGGTPGIENSVGVPLAQYALTIAFEGNVASATIKSDPAGLVCATSCAGSFASGTQITLTPSAGSNTAFSGWSGVCYGQTVCSFAITATTSLVADFISTLPPPPSGGGDGEDPLPVEPAATSTPSSTPPDGDGGTPGGANHILIAAVQIAGAVADNDLVTLYNPTGATVDMSGWKLHKRSATGTDYSLKVFPAGSVIAAAGSFTWANSESGFSEAAGANVSSTETLSADNSVALLDAAGNVIDAVAWGTGTGQYGEGPPYPTSPGANQLLSRRSSGGAMEDTDNNTNDFTIQ